MNIHICCGPELEEVVRRTDGDPRWCFRCRKPRGFLYVVQAPVGLSWYGPTPHVECATCGAHDGDLFPGIAREWED